MKQSAQIDSGVAPTTDRSQMPKKVLTTSALLAVLVLVCGASSVSACTCLGPRMACQALWTADAVFVGTVTSKEGNRAYREPRVFKFSVDEAFRGIASNVVEVGTGWGGGDCGFRFEVGQQYLVYAYKGTGENSRLTTSICTRTRATSQASEDLEYLRGLPQAAPGSTIQGEVHRFKRNSDGNASHSPLPGVRVKIEGDSGQVYTTTDDQGKFSVKGLSPGMYQVSLELAKGLIARGEKHSVRVNDKGCAFVAFGVESDTRLSGRVLNTSQSAIANAEIFIMAAGKEKYQGYWNSANSKDDGFYQFWMIPPGKYVLRIRFDGLTGPTRPFPTLYYPGVSDQSQATVIEIGEGQRIENYNLTMPDLPKERIVEGTVTTSDGRLLAEAKVSYGTDSVIYAVSMVGPGHFRLHVYEGVKIALQARVELGDGKRPVSDWLEIPATGDATGIKLVIPSQLVPK